MIRRLHAGAPDFASELERLLAFSSSRDPDVVTTVEAIVAAVRERGDDALIEYTRRLDRRDLRDADELEIGCARLESALGRIPVAERRALEAAAGRIESYHRRQCQESWTYRDADGTLLGQRITPMDRVGVYVPGGKASYPSTVLMNAIPARVAGVAEIIMTVPMPDGVVKDIVLAAASIAGVDRVFGLGGAQAIAALALGTPTIPAVDKIVGPGNVYVAEAKRQLFGYVGVDMIAGPSEIVVLCDGRTDPDWISYDLFSQAEHDEDAQAILISPDGGFLDRVAASMQARLGGMARSRIIAASLERRGALIEVSDLEQAARIINRIAPEHLELSIEEPELLLPAIRHAGAIFLGRHTSEAIGDYCAGPSHVLPTSGTARFSSPLGVYDFQKRTSLVGCSRESAVELGRTAAVLADAESLEAHALSARARIPRDPAE